MHGNNLIGFNQSSKGVTKLKAYSTLQKSVLDGEFVQATSAEINEAAELAKSAYGIFRKKTALERAAFLSQITEELLAQKESLVARAHAETALPLPRLNGEVDRTVNQLKLFAEVLTKGEYFAETREEAMPDRLPLPKPSLHKTFMPIGPVLVFGASNFPFAFSTAGGDTAAALAAGCPVIVKAHPGHLGTNEMVADCIAAAAKKTNMPAGVFSSLNGEVEVAKELISHSAIKAIAFTGSQKAGMAILRAAHTDRIEPIPVFAEMGSINPMLLLPEIVATDANALAEKIAGSITLGAGQFCTKPGILLILDNEHTTAFIEKLGAALSKVAATTMLNQSVYNNFATTSAHVTKCAGVSTITQVSSSDDSYQAGALLLKTTGANFLQEKNLQEEVFGPTATIVICKDEKELEHVISNLQGQLTATIFAMPNELEGRQHFVGLMAEKAGRVIFNNVPTGVEVSRAMIHGGPFPASTDARFTSVGTDAILRFVRPVCLQNMPSSIQL